MLLHRLITATSFASASWSEQTKILASDFSASDYFGFSVSINSDGNTLVVGAYAEDPSGISNAGAAYVFTRSGSTWTEQAKLTASDKAASDFFGYSVAINADGNTIIVGARDDAGGGSAYIFTRSGSSWSQQAKITASDRAASDYFGETVAISSDGNTAIVGASAEDPSGISNAGAAYIFTRSGSSWSQQAKIVASDKAAVDRFGFSVSISSDGNTAIIGAYGDDPDGAAYIFTRSGSTWSQQAKIIAPEGGVFGYSVAVSGDGNTVIVGAYRYTESPVVAMGAAYVFTRSGSSWSQQAKLLASDGEAYEEFGIAVSLNSDGNVALVGARYANSSGASQSGAAYVFNRSGSTWTETAILIASDSASSDRFGEAVSLNQDGNTIIIGAYAEDPSGINAAGAAYVFVLE